MATSEEQVRKLYNSMLIPLGIIYSKYLRDGLGPSGPGSGLREPKVSVERSFSEIPLVFHTIPGHQFGIFLGDLVPEKYLWGEYGTTRTCVVIDVIEVNKTIPDIDSNGVGLLIAHELAHAFRWYLGHLGGDNGYTNEVWARMFELGYVEALKDDSIYARTIGVEFAATVAFIKKYRKSLYKGSAAEKHYYTELTGDNDWPVTVASVPSKCPKGDPYCFRPAGVAMFHIDCKPA